MPYGNLLVIINNSVYKFPILKFLFFMWGLFSPLFYQTAFWCFKHAEILSEI